MQINPNVTPNILADLQQSQSTLNTALQQVATGLSVSVPSDNPAASAAMVQNTIETGNVDQYTKNISTVLASVESASSVLSNVVTALTQAVSLGTEGANGTNTTSNLQAIAAQVQGVLSTIVSQANTSVAGSYLFGGTGSSTPYTADPSSPTGYTYNGNTDQTSVAVGDSLSVQVNLPGSQIFSDPSNNVLGALSSLVTALQSGDTIWYRDCDQLSIFGDCLRRKAAGLLRECGKPVELARYIPATGNRDPGIAGDEPGGHKFSHGCSQPKSGRDR